MPYRKPHPPPVERLYPLPSWMRRICCAIGLHSPDSYCAGCDIDGRPHVWRCVACNAVVDD